VAGAMSGPADARQERRTPGRILSPFPVGSIVLFPPARCRSIGLPAFRP